MLAKKRFAEQIAGAGKMTYSVIRGKDAAKGRRDILFGGEVHSQPGLQQ